MYDIEDKVELRHGADQLGFQEGCPFLLQSALPSEITLMERGFTRGGKKFSIPVT